MLELKLNHADKEEYCMSTQQIVQTALGVESYQLSESR